MRDAAPLIVSTLALATLLAASPAVRAQDAGAPASAPDGGEPPDATPALAPLPPAPAPATNNGALPGAPVDGKMGKKGKHKKARSGDADADVELLTGDGDATAAPPPDGLSPPETPRMAPTGEDPFGDEEETHFDTRMLLQIRYARTQLDKGSLAREGDIDPVTGAPFSQSEAEHQAFYQQLTAAKQDGYTLHRAFLRLTAKAGKHVKTKFLVDFADVFYNDPEKAVKLAYVELEPVKRVKIYAGLFKRTFSLLELLPIARFELADTGPTDDFIKDLGWGGRDVGLMVEVEPLPKKRWLRLYMGSYSGDSQEGYDATPWKLITGRVEFEPIKNHLRLGADFAWRPSTTLSFKYKDNPTDATPYLDKGKAASADITINGEGFELRAEALLGDRTDIAFRNNASRFFGSWFVARYLFPVGDVRLMPTLRAEWLDADYGHAGGGRFLGSAALNIGFTRSVWLMLDVSRHDAERGAPALNHVPSAATQVRGLDADWFAFVAQLQLEI